MSFTHKAAPAVLALMFTPGGARAQTSRRPDMSAPKSMPGAKTDSPLLQACLISEDPNDFTAVCTVPNISLDDVIQIAQSRKALHLPAQKMTIQFPGNKTWTGDPAKLEAIQQGFSQNTDHKGMKLYLYPADTLTILAKDNSDILLSGALVNRFTVKVTLHALEGVAKDIEQHPAHKPAGVPSR